MNDFVNNTKVNVFTQKVFDATNSTRERRQLIIDHCISSCIKVNQCKYVLPSKCKVQYVLCMSVADYVIVRGNALLFIVHLDRFFSLNLSATIKMLLLKTSRSLQFNIVICLGDWKFLLLHVTCA